MTLQEKLDMATAHQVYIEGYKEDLYRRNLKDMEQTSDKTIQLLAALAVLNLSDLSKTQLNTVIREIRVLHKTTQDKYIASTLKSLERFAAIEAKYAFDSIEDTSTVQPSAFFDEAVEKPLSSTGDTLNEFLLLAWLAYTRRVTNEVRKSWVNGTPLTETLKEIKGTKSRKNLDGITMQTGAKGLRSSLDTAVQHVSAVTLSAAWASAGLNGYEWVSVLDQRTSTICRGLDGRIFETGKGPLPPAHPRCRSTIIARQVTDKTPEFARRETYYDWLKRQSPPVQEKVLGKTRSRLFASGKITAQEFSKLSLDRTFEPRTLQDLERLIPDIFNDITTGVP